MVMIIHWKYIIGNMFWFKKFKTEVNLNYFFLLFIVNMKIRHISVTLIYTVVLGMGGQTSLHTQIMVPPAGLRFPTFLNYVGVVWLLHCLPQQAVEQNLTAASDMGWLNYQVTSLQCVSPLRDNLGRAGHIAWMFATDTRYHQRKIFAGMLSCPNHIMILMCSLNWFHCSLMVCLDVMMELFSF